MAGIYWFLHLSEYTLKSTPQISRCLFRITSVKGPLRRVSDDTYTLCFPLLSEMPQPLLLFGVVKPCMKGVIIPGCFYGMEGLLNEGCFTAITASVAEVLLLIFNYIRFSSLLKEKKKIFAKKPRVKVL